MKILIGYYTKSGTTAKCAELLKKQFHNHTTELVDLATAQPHLEDYDTVLLGAPIRMGRMDKRFRAYLKANERALGEVRLGIFACCGATELAGEVMERSVPKSLAAHAIAQDSFGGELNVKAQKGLKNI